MKWMEVSLLTVTFGQLILVAKSSEVLMLTPFGSRSHKNVFIPLAEGLAKKGHHITLISGFTSLEKVTNLTELSYPDLQQFFAMQKMNLIKEGNEGFTYAVVTEYQDILRRMCSHFFEHGPLLNWVKNKKLFDAVIVDSVLNECILPVAEFFGHATILLSTANLPPWVSRPLNIPNPYSYIPFFALPFRSKMDFWQRLENTFAYEMWNFIEKWYCIPKTSQVVRQYFSEVKPYNEPASTYDFVLVNADPVFNVPRPSMPYVTNVGGMHCRPAKPLPKIFNDYIDSSGEHGFVIFSLGSIFDDSMMTAEKKAAFLSAFARLPQKILWKFEQEVEGVPQNVKIFKWLPQQDLLGHPKVRAFLTHGGLLSLQEAIYHGVPMVGIPLFAEQPSNVAMAEDRGVAIGLNWEEVTEEKIYQALKRACNDASMKQAAQTYSHIFRDRQLTPVDIAIYWTEYVIRHRGAKHLRSAADELNTMQYLLLDVIVTLLVVILVAGWLLFTVFRYAVRSYRNRRPDIPSKKLKAN